MQPKLAEMVVNRSVAVTLGQGRLGRGNLDRRSKPVRGFAAGGR